MAEQDKTIEPNTQADPAQSLLSLARELQTQGLIDQLPPDKRIKMLKLLEPEMVKEREEALQPRAQLVAKEKNDSDFIDQIIAPIRSAAKDPVAAVVNTARGVFRAFQPGGILGQDLETMEALSAFPIIRGAELVARMFVPEDQRPDLTTFAQVVNEQKRLDKNLRQLTPGVQEGAEIVSVLYGVGSLVKAAAPVAGKLVKKGVVSLQTLRAERATETAKQIAMRRLKVSEGPLLDAIISRPEQVLAKSKQSGVEVKEVAFQLKDELETIKNNLGSNVGKHRDAAFADNKTRISIPEDIPEAIRVVRARTTLDGESVLPRELERQLAYAERAAKFGVTTPNQAMVWVDVLDGIIDYGESGKAGGNTIRSANGVLMQLRGSVKAMLRDGSPNSKGWADSDTAFRGFLAESQGIIERLGTDSAEGLVDNLFGKNKSILRDRLERSLDYMNQVDPMANGHGNAFLSRLADLKAGDKLKDVNMEVNRVLQENTNEIVRYWTNIGGEAGGLAASGPTAFSAHAMNLDPTKSTTATAIAYGAGRLAGRQAGFKIGQVMANPEKALQAAIKAKNLSTQARKLAKDMVYLNNSYGPKSSIAFLDLVGPIPVVNELVKFTQTQTKQKENDNAKR